MRKLRFAVLLILAMAFITCSAIPGGAQQAPAVINLINLPADNSAEVYYAQDMGFFKEAGLDVRITAMTNSAAIVAALAGGAGDIGNSVIGSAAQARRRGIPVRFIAPAGLYVDATPTSALVVPKDSPLRSAADLGGKTIAVSGLNDLTYYATRAWIDKNGGNSANSQYVELPFPAMGAALQQHRVDAAYNIEPFLTATKAEFRILGRAGGGVAPRYQATGWLATDSWLASHADVALRFSAVIRRTAIWANAHHKESAAILLKYTKIDPEVAASMNRVEYSLTLQPNLVQPPIDVAAKYGGQLAIPANDLIWAPAK
ncbi:MAG TPA: ABC transporter substrate-binding protein [Candidatus Binatia bacterium]|nr:ABC transporter substrate-binding protein [Candidatus Binatia bacterium]